MNSLVQDPALPKDSLILVTGASGFIGSHVVNEALKAGYRVRGITRSEEKAENTKKVFDHPYYDTAVVADFGHEGVFDDAVRGCHAVIHVASDVSFGIDPNKVVTPTVAGIRSLLRSASRASVKRFVLTSSSLAAFSPQYERDFEATTETWNDLATEIAWAPPPYTADRAYPVYATSKAEAEKAMWEFIKDEKPGFVANSILPNCNMGPAVPRGPLNVTGRAVIDAFRGEIPPIRPQYMIDVVDDARLHVIAAVLDSSLENERIFAFNVPFTWTEIIGILHKMYPGTATIARAPENEPRDRSKVPNQLGAELLKKWYDQKTGYKPLEQTIQENLEGVV